MLTLFLSLALTSSVGTLQLVTSIGNFGVWEQTSLISFSSFGQISAGRHDEIRPTNPRFWRDRSRSNLCGQTPSQHFGTSPVQLPVCLHWKQQFTIVILINSKEASGNTGAQCKEVNPETLAKEPRHPTSPTNFTLRIWWITKVGQRGVLHPAVSRLGNWGFTYYDGP